MKEYTCCVTGHRDVTPNQARAAVALLADEILLACLEGYTRFISGMAQGIDQLFADDVLILKEHLPELKLVAAISHRGRLKTKDENFQRIIKQCDEVVVLSEFYHPGIYDARNRWMLENSSRLIAAWDGRVHGGSYRTILLAGKMGLNVRDIDMFIY